MQPEETNPLRAGPRPAAVGPDALLAALRAYLCDLSEPPLPDFLGGIDWDMPRRDIEPRRLPCLVHLPRAASEAGRDARDLAGQVAAGDGDLRWGQTYGEADFGRAFLDNYGWMELFGSRGHFENERMAGGFLLLGPHTIYPDHHHAAEEIYVPLTSGTEWRKGSEAFATRNAGEVVHHPGNVAHAMRTGEAPLLALYLWRGGPLAQRSVIDAAGGSGAG